MKKFFIISSILVVSSFTPNLFASNENKVATEFVECYEDCQHIKKQLKKFSKNGNPLAQTILGASYKTGEILGEINDGRAWKWMKQAKRQQFPPAYYYLSQWYREGYQTDVDIELANEYLERAAEHHFPPAQLDWGLLLLQNDKIEEGLTFIEKSAEKRNPKAINFLANLKNKLNEKKQLITTHTSLPTNNDSIDPNIETIEISGNQIEPMELLESVLADIHNLGMYNDNRSTGSRFSYRKCGDKNSSCTVIKVDPINAKRIIEDLIN